LIFVVAEDNDARFSAKRVEHFIFLNGEYTHCRNCLGNPLCSKGTVVGEVNLDVCVLRFDAGFLLAETSQPRVAIGVGGVESGEEGLGAFTFEVKSANVGCRLIEIAGQAGALE
jgi:hypothetical protein